MEQLKLTAKHLSKIGFTKRIYKHGMNLENIVYEIPCLNGCFYYNKNQSIYRWYQKIVIGENANHINLNIKSLPELFMILSCFRIKYNLVT
uniref:Uncharacterized protein n=1 Tax=viral metagenome TaxID=1070528 RepID=A0A6H1ZRL0_9ZZZZ